MRKRTNINDKWKFSCCSYAENINIPHTWNAMDGQSGGGDYYRGIGTYRKTFKRPNFDRTQEKVFLECMGINASCEVFLNNQKIGSHEGGYSIFRVEMTQFLENSNILEIIVDNGINDSIYPQKADFTFYGGIYRDVNIVTIAKEHFDLSYYGTPGIKVTSDVCGAKGIIEVQTYSEVNEAKVKIDIMNEEGHIVASNVGGFNQTLTIENVHLWHGIVDPYLYTVKAELIVGDCVRDMIETRIGVRTIEVDPNKGFFLNGESFPLRGVSRHQDYRAIGNALSKEHHIKDMEMIKEIGANTIRLAHYQHDQFFYDLCDEYGMIVWAEIPYISEHMPNAKENSVSQMKELIIQNYNHPSIVTWGISNEITISTKDKKDMLDNHYFLNALCHQMDSTRPTTLACYAMCNPFSKVVHITDIVGYNLYLGWYIPGFFWNDLFMKAFHFFYPKKPLGYSEYGCEGMPNLHSEKPRRGDHTEEYQAMYHEYLLKCFDRHPFLWSTHVWNMFDFAADARDQGGEPGMNHKGLVTFDRKIKKDSFYLYQAYWSKKPMVHICSKRFKERAVKKIKVKVYSNQSYVELYNNGELIGKSQGEKVFEFMVELNEINNIKAVAGEVMDSATFIKVKQRNESYKLKKQTKKSENWV